MISVVFFSLSLAVLLSFPNKRSTGIEKDRYVSVFGFVFFCLIESAWSNEPQHMCVTRTSLSRLSYTIEIVVWISLICFLLLLLLFSITKPRPSSRFLREIVWRWTTITTVHHRIIPIRAFRASCSVVRLDTIISKPHMLIERSIGNVYFSDHTPSVHRVSIIPLTNRLDTILPWWSTKR